MKKLILLIILFTSFASGYSQVDEKLSPEEKARREKNIQAGNPFKKLGYYPKIATLSKGKYLEFHDLDSIVRIGSFTFNTNTMSVVNYVRLDTVHSEATLRPELISRWFSTDPLSDEYPSWSPYNFVMGNPIRFIDPDGRAVEDIIVLLNPDGGKGYGHMAILVGNDDTGWTFISKEGRNKEPWYSNVVSGGPALKPKILHFSKLEDFKKELKDNKELAVYNKSLRFKTSTDVDEEVKTTVTKSAKSWYNVVTANCADAVSDGLEKADLNPGGIPTPNGIDGNIYPSNIPVIPNSRFKYIKEFNQDKIIPTYPNNSNNNNDDKSNTNNANTNPEDKTYRANQ